MEERLLRLTFHVSRMTRQYFFIGTSLLLLLWSCTVSAEVPKNLTLEASIQIARQTNLLIQTTQERVKSAEAQVRSAQAGLLPNVSINSTYRYAGALPKSVLEASGAFGPPGAGGDMPPATVGDGDDENVIELEFGAHHNFQADLSLNQPIFAWGRYYKSYQSAKLNLEAARKELDAAYNQLVLDVSEAFYRVLLSLEFVKVSEQTVELVETQLKIAQNLFEAGASTNFDVLRAEVLLANAKSNLIRAKNGARGAMDVYKNVLNIDLGDSVEVEGSLDRPILESVDLDRLIRLGLEKRPELHQLAFNEGAAKKQVDVAKTRSRPALSFFTNYQLDHNERLIEMNRVWNLGFALNFPIFDGLATRAAVKQAESGLKQTQLGKQQMTDVIELEVRSAYLNLLEARTLINVQRETVAQAQESVRIANLRYENGMITSVELTDAQLALSQAEVNRLQSLHDYAVGLARLEKAIGEKIPINN